MTIKPFRICAFVALALGLRTFISVSPVQAQTTQRVDVAGDGTAFSVALNSSELGKEYALLTELKAKSAATATITLKGPAGIVGKVFVKVVPASTDINTLDLNPLYWTPIPVRYVNGDFKAEIITGEDPYLGEGQALNCPPYLSASEINYMLEQLRLVYGPNFSRIQLCQLLTAQLGGFNSSVVFNDEGGPEGDALTARGVIQRDACSSAYKYIVQYRINPTGLPWYQYTGLNNITASLKVAPATPVSGGVKPGAWRLKDSEGRNKGSKILITPALGATYDQKFGAPGTDKLFIQYWKNGVVPPKKEHKGKTRILFGSKLFMINKDPVGKHLNGKKKTITLVNGERAFSFCAALKAEDSCNKAYAKATGIKCKKIYSK